MESQQELRIFEGEEHQAGLPNETIFTGPAEKHTKARPSVDIGLAQNYKERQDLPTVDEEPAEDGPEVETEYVKIMLDESLRADQARQRQTARSSLSLSGPESDGGGGKLPRDRVTGRTLSEHGRSCLRCTDKGLRCTFNFVGKDDEAQCAACRRSGTQYCVRFRLPRGDKENRRRRTTTTALFRGQPWKNPNLVAGTADGGGVPELGSEELERLLREFYDGPSGYVLGDYVVERDVRNFALPPFNGADLPPWYRPDDYETMDWRDVLPVWKNRSLRPRRVEGEVDEARESRKRRLVAARNRALWPAVGLDYEEKEEGGWGDGGDDADDAHADAE